MILITTTRRPSQRTRSFVRDLYHVIPNAIRRNRGKSSLEDLNRIALKLGAERVLIVGTKKGNPSSLYFFEPAPLTIKPISLIRLKGVTLRREMTRRRAPPSKELCVSYQSEFLSKLAEVLLISLKAKKLVSSPLDGLKGFNEECDIFLYLISEREDLPSTVSFFKAVPLIEIGPRIRVGGFELFDESRYQSPDKIR